MVASLWFQHCRRLWSARAWENPSWADQGVARETGSLQSPSGTFMRVRCLVCSHSQVASPPPPPSSPRSQPLLPPGVLKPGFLLIVCPAIQEGVLEMSCRMVAQVIGVGLITISSIFLLSYGLGRCIRVPEKWQDENGVKYGSQFNCPPGKCGLLLFMNE